MLGNPRGFLRVHIFRHGYLKTFGRIAGCVAAYAFVLNLLLVALSGALNAGNTSYDASWAGAVPAIRGWHARPRPRNTPQNSTASCARQAVSLRRSHPPYS